MSTYNGMGLSELLEVGEYNNTMMIIVTATKNERRCIECEKYYGKDSHGVNKGIGDTSLCYDHALKKLYWRDMYGNDTF